MVKRLVSIILSITILALIFTACEKETSTNQEYWEKVKKVDAPIISSGAMSQSEFESKFRPYTEWRIYDIRTAKSDIKPQDKSKGYYVSNSGNDENDGLSPKTAVATYGAISDKLQSGDVVYFERGNEFRGNITVNTPGITLTAFGDGKAPVFHHFKRNCVGDGEWKETDTKNVYIYKERVADDVGQIVFNDKLWTYKSMRTKKDISNANDIRYVNSYKDLCENLQMYHDPIKKYLYVYCDEGNPGLIYDSVELGTGGNLIKVTVDNVTIDGLCVKNCGYGISASTDKAPYVIKGLTVRNCEFGWIGGYSRDGQVRLGNGIEIWGGAVDFTVENNYFYQIYDAGTTFQYISQENETFVENVSFCNNVFEYCNYSVEYFMTIAGKNKIKNYVIDGNLCWYAGQGLCNQRPDKATASHIKSWTHDNNQEGKIQITNNLFALSLYQLTETLDDTGLGGAYNNNIYVQTEKRRISSNGCMDVAFRMDENAEKNIETKLGDKNAVIISIDRE